MTKFLNADTFFHLLKQFRVLWLKGGFGSGKTALSVIIAAELWRQKLITRVVSNIPVAGALPPIPPLAHTCLLLDEAHLYMDSWNDAKGYLTFVRKANLFLLMPSAFAVNVRIRFFTVQRVLNAYLIGLPFWIYEWRLNDGASTEKGRFMVWRPDHVFGVYDTNAIPLDDGGIVEALRVTYGVDKQEAKRKREQQTKLNARSASGVGDTDQSSEHSEYAAGIERLEQRSIRASRRRR